ncbi:hypothetical protein [Sphingobium sp. CAP-1]|uniref:hypothetical protein n=1 Tax=Sphingobium sp. CAP-1 TaxID=2676077 RepID=UPI0012BB2902|nr:hypothetical protein [Sphingobium sp. CAP-1]QGP80855.1 hypothetical protein GL174_17390 [Sphingobium sp. CAP-1]
MGRARGTTLAAILAIGVLTAARSAPAMAAAPTKAEVDNAAHVLRVVMTALQSNEVEQPVKRALFDCLYSNSIGEISAASDKVIAANPGKVDRQDASQMLAVIAGACGYRPAPSKPAPRPAPKR